MNKTVGFTLIEMLVVLAIIAILAVIALPSPQPMLARQQVTESLGLIEDYKKLVAFYYTSSHTFLKNNAQACIPAPDKLLGNFVDNIALVDGAFQLHFGNKAVSKLKGKYLSVRPIVVTGSPESPISWVCGAASVPQGMQAIGENKTDIAISDLPMECRI